MAFDRIHDDVEIAEKLHRAGLLRHILVDLVD
jgi:hypothetical protein